MSAAPHVGTWWDRAWTVLLALAASGVRFSADDVADQVGTPDLGHEPNARNNTVGALFNAARRAGLIVSDGRLVRSRQPHRKGGAIRTWIGTPKAREEHNP